MRYSASLEGWACATAQTGLAWLDLRADDPRIVEVWEILVNAGTPGDVLDVLTREGLAATPSFVIATWTGTTMSLLARGRVVATAASAVGEERIDPSRNATWAEHVIDEVTGIRLDISTPATGPEMPLVSGVVRADRVVVVLGAGAPAGPIAEPPVESDAEETIVPRDLEAAVAAAEVAPEPKAEASVHDLVDELFGATVARSVEDAAVRGPSEPIPPPPAAGSGTPTDVPILVPPPRLGDHDDATIFGDDLVALFAAEPAAVPAAPVAPALILRSSAGETISLARPVIIGRSPTVTTLTASGELPDLVSVVSSNADVSRSHVQFTVEGGTVVVTDLHSRNGTICTLPGRPATRLRPGEQTPIIVGTLVDLGGGATYTVDVTS